MVNWVYIILFIIILSLIGYILLSKLSDQKEPAPEKVVEEIVEDFEDEMEKNAVSAKDLQT